MKTILRILTVAAAFTATALASAQASQFRAGGNYYNLQTQSVVDMHFKSVVRQAYDLSCGAAAMATLMKYYYGDDIDEIEIIETMVEIGDPEKISEFGFSMLELKRFAETKNYLSQGFRIDDVANLVKLKVPVITLINSRGYKHFVVLKKVQGDSVMIADPAFGNVVKTLDQFAEEWNNVVLVILSGDRDGEVQFAQDLSITAALDQIMLLMNRVQIPGSRRAGEF